MNQEYPSDELHLGMSCEFPNNIGTEGGDSWFQSKRSKPGSSTQRGSVKNLSQIHLGPHRSTALRPGNYPYLPLKGEALYRNLRRFLFCLLSF